MIDYLLRIGSTDNVIYGYDSLIWRSLRLIKSIQISSLGIPPLLKTLRDLRRSCSSLAFSCIMTWASFFSSLCASLSAFLIFLLMTFSSFFCLSFQWPAIRKSFSIRGAYVGIDCGRYLLSWRYSSLGRFSGANY